MGKNRIAEALMISILREALGKVIGVRNVASQLTAQTDCSGHTRRFEAG